MEQASLAFFQSFYTNVSLYVVPEPSVESPVPAAAPVAALVSAPVVAVVPPVAPPVAEAEPLPPTRPAAAAPPVVEAAPVARPIVAAVSPAAPAVPATPAPSKLPSLGALPLPPAVPVAPAVAAAVRPVPPAVDPVVAPMVRPVPPAVDPVAATVRPVAPAVVPAAPAGAPTPADGPPPRTAPPLSATPYSTLGSNANGLIILVRLDPVRFQRLPRNVFLNNLLKAIRLVMADVVLINVESHLPVELKTLRQQLAAKQIIGFGKNLLDVAIRTTQQYEPVLLAGDAAYLPAAEIELIEEDNSRKKLLWQAMQRMFLS